MSPIFPLKKSSAIVDNPGMAPSLAVRITLPFSDISGVVRAWALKADKLLCYEHTGEQTNKDHVHLLMIRVSCDPERLKQIARELRECGSGNEFWTFKKKTKAHGDVSEENSSRYITYMSKGVHDPKYNKGYDPEEIEELKKEWTEKEILESRDTKCYAAFEEYIYQYWKANPQLREDYFVGGTTVFNIFAGATVAKLARAWAFNVHNRIWNVRTATDSKMVCLTYCMRYDITIPKEIKFW